MLLNRKIYDTASFSPFYEFITNKTVRIDLYRHEYVNDTRIDLSAFCWWAMPAYLDRQIFPMRLTLALLPVPPTMSHLPCDLCATEITSASAGRLLGSVAAYKKNKVRKLNNGRTSWELLKRVGAEMEIDLVRLVGEMDYNSTQVGYPTAPRQK